MKTKLAPAEGSDAYYFNTWAGEKPLCEALRGEEPITDVKDLKKLTVGNAIEKGIELKVLDRKLSIGKKRFSETEVNITQTSTMSISIGASKTDSLYDTLKNHTTAALIPLRAKSYLDIL
jgi:hypothetical protein